MFSSLFFGACVMLCFSAIAGDESITTTKAGDKSCPPVVGIAAEAFKKVVGGSPIKGETCKADSVFHYYECCGDTYSQCCFKLQIWVIVVLAVLAAIILTSVVLSLLRCFFCRR